MKYNPNQHHRRSIRLKGYDYASSGAYFITICSHQRQCLFGEIVDGEMQLSKFGEIVRSYWLNLPKYHPRLQLDAFVVMPNHIHGILVLSDIPVGAGLDNQLVDLTNKSSAKPAPTNPTEPINHPGIPEIIRRFKTFSARRINQRRKMVGTPVWQRNYYDRIIRNDEALQAIRQYVHNNPLSWQEDQLHPDV
ncbi:MAG: transposase [Leptolyngbyaceae cyanobacterium bins.302]|nr:transposase [Leptolyngbyaceae cyanobacterium bins.302]